MSELRALQTAARIALIRECDRIIRWVEKKGLGDALTLDQIKDRVGNIACEAMDAAADNAFQSGLDAATDAASGAL